MTDDNAGEASAPHAKWRRRYAGAVIVAGLLLLAWAATALVVPGVVEKQAQRVASERLGRPLSIGSVAFDPWTLELTIVDVALAGAVPGALPQAEAKRVRVDLAWVSLVRFAPIVEALSIDAPMLRLTRIGDGRLDVEDIVQRLAAAPPDAKESDEPARFAVHDIAVRGGSADYVDQTAGATHRIRDLELGVPFLSSLASHRETTVEPRLAFTLDGARFDTTTTTTPYSARGPGEMRLKVESFDVAPWLAHVPKTSPVRLKAAQIGTDLTISFERRPRLGLRIAGTIAVSGLDVRDASAGELLNAANVKVAIDELRPLEAVAKIGRIDIDAARLLAVRNAAGKVNLLFAADEPAAVAVALAKVPLPTSAARAAAQASDADATRAQAPANSAAAGAAGQATSAANGASTRMASAAAAGTSAQPQHAGAPASRWKVAVGAVSIRAATLDWRDATTAPAAALALGDFALDAQAIAWPLDAPVVFQGEGVLGTAHEHGKLAFSGRGNGKGATVDVKLAALPMSLLAPYLRQAVAAPVGGELSADVALQWRPPMSGDGPARIALDAKRLTLSRFALGDGASPELAADSIELSQARIDTAARTASLGKVVMSAPRVRVERDRERRWNFERWRAADDPAASAGRAAATSAPIGAASASASPWRVRIGELAIDKGRVGLQDRASGVPVGLDVFDLSVQMRGYSLDSSPSPSPSPSASASEEGTETGTGKGTAGAAPFRIAARVAVPSAPGSAPVGSGVVGSVEARGELSAMASGVPSAAKASVVLKDLPLHLLDPYLDDLLNVDVQKAQTSFTGEVAWSQRPGGASVAAHGDATVEDFRATSALAERAAPQRALAMVREGGRRGRQLLSWKSLALRGVDLKLAPGEPTRLAVAETALSDFFARVVLDETGRLNLQDVARAPGGAASAPPSSGAASAAGGAVARSGASGRPPIVSFGPITVAGGRVAYDDRFVKPNYSANLTELSGRLSTFSSEPAAPGQPPRLADLALRGRVEGTASLDIDGQVNPLARPLALDIHAKVRDLELPPLSPYSIKYAGYGIERGKMSVDLAYVVQPDGKLTASNKIVLNQLAFGDKVEGAPASLPVKLAVALLADRNGVIDLDLPIGGSINDPQFSIGGLIWKAVSGLIVKAVTAPFALIASAFGGGASELSSVEFVPGTANLTPDAMASLDKVAKALEERPGLTLTVVGESRLESERDAWKKDRLRQIVRAEKRRQAIAGGAAASVEVTVSDAEYPALLKEVYKRADIVKPKNAIGIVRDLTADEMETVLLASIVVADDAMQQLAVRRGVAVRDYLAARNLPTSRLFLGAPKALGEATANWTPRADLKLQAG